MMVFPSGYVVLLLSRGKNRIKITVWSIVMILTVAGYLTNYNFHVIPQSPLLVLENPLNGMFFFLTFFANILYPFVDKQFLPVIIAGGFILAFYGYLVFFRWRNLQQNPVVLSSIFFILLSVATIAFSRIGIGIEAATADRYRLLAAVFLALVYISGLQSFKKIKKWVWITILVSSILFYLVRTGYGFYKLDKQKTMLTNGIITFKNSGKCPETLYPNADRGTWIVTNSIRQNIYCPPNLKTKVGVLSGEKGLGK
jgi:hypothetical protein